MVQREVILIFSVVISNILQLTLGNKLDGLHQVVLAHNEMTKQEITK